MVHTSILLPQNNAADAVAALLPTLRRALDRLGHDYEVIVIDDGSTDDSLRTLQALLPVHDCLKVLRLEQSAGLSAALTAGVAASGGEEIVAMEASERFRVEQIGELLAHLARADLVYGRPRRSGWAKARHRLGRIPRWLLLGLEVRDPDCLFWAARREAVEGLDLPRGMYRYLATLVAARGFRVGEVAIDAGPSARPLSDGRPNPGDLLAAWWLQRRWRRIAVQQLETERTATPNLKVHREVA
jgi:glycosyltransferase involved in cell wall biosynthesis